MTAPVHRLTALRNQIDPAQQLIVQSTSNPGLNATFIDHKATGPADLARERANASFDIESMKRFWIGGKEQLELYQLVFQTISRDPELYMPDGHYFDMTREQNRELCTMGQIRRAVQIRNSTPDKAFGTALLRGLAAYSESFGMRVYVHDLLFKQALTLFGTPEQRAEWDEDIEKCRVLGCFAMTELGHSSFLRGLETTATYDEKRDEFIIHSPTLTSTKWWIGMAGQTATHTVAICQTIIHGKNHGINWFIVPLRDPKTGALLPGVTCGDIGSKMGRQGLDNGWIQFSQVHIPRNYMLMKWASVDRGGKFHPAPNPAMAYATLVPERLSIMEGMGIMITQPVVIAVRYGCVRRQGNKDQQIMDYQSHYVGLAPAVALLYVLNVSGRAINHEWDQLATAAQSDAPKYLRRIGDMHAVSAGIKATFTWMGSDILETCRRACGGHAYSSYNNIAASIADWGVTTTGAGDNVVLLQQTGRLLLGCIREVSQGKKIEGSASYLNDLMNILGSSKCTIENDNDWYNLDILLELLTWLVTKRLQDTALAISSSQSFEESWNNHLLSIVRTAEIYSQRHVLYVYIQSISALKSDKEVSPLIPTLLRMGQIFALQMITKYTDAFLEEGYFSPIQAKAVQAAFLDICKQVRPDLVALTDAWGFPDFILKAPIGRYDGDIYPAYLNTLRSAPGCFGIPPYFEKHIRPLTDPDLNGKNKEAEKKGASKI